MSLVFISGLPIARYSSALIPTSHAIPYIKPNTPKTNPSPCHFSPNRSVAVSDPTSNKPVPIGKARAKTIRFTR